MNIWGVRFLRTYLIKVNNVYCGCFKYLFNDIIANANNFIVYVIAKSYRTVCTCTAR